MNQIGFHSSKLGHRTSIFSSANGITICSKINELGPHLGLLKQVEVKVLESGPKVFIKSRFKPTGITLSCTKVPKVVKHQKEEEPCST